MLSRCAWDITTGSDDRLTIVFCLFGTILSGPFEHKTEAELHLLVGRHGGRNLRWLLPLCIT